MLDNVANSTTGASILSSQHRHSVVEFTAFTAAANVNGLSLFVVFGSDICYYSLCRLLSFKLDIEYTY